MKNNFTQMEIGFVVANLAPEMNVRLTTSNNITINRNIQFSAQSIYFK